jgi:isopentenyl diphosphate isomerase/L-lactate dehydrogenase-like FMN-dependent dehydrogenase
VPDDLRTIADYEQRADALLAPGPLAYVAGGSGDEITLRDNVAAWQRLAIRPRVLVDVSRRSAAVTVLGRERPHPLIVAPTAFQRTIHDDAELATARAAVACGATICVSTLATTGLAELAAAVPDASRWFQLYVFRDRGVTDELIATAAAQGYEALVVTVDVPFAGVRDRERRARFSVPPSMRTPSLDMAGRNTDFDSLGFAQTMDARLTWRDVERFAGESGMPVLIKGILRPDDARLAVEHGAAGIVVSNHGGRQLDTVLASADALPPIVDEVGEEIDVLVDGGIRRGTDVLKALALGARAVLLGRPVLWGLGVAGESGVRHVLELLLDELDAALALAGVPIAAELDRTCVQRTPWVNTNAKVER